MATIIAEVDNAQAEERLKAFLESLHVKYEVAYPDDELCLTFPVKKQAADIKKAFSVMITQEIAELL